ncbi:MAG: phosphotransferase family protein [Ectothiorhodospiraceae bacterium]|nr:phosphotransferase family protein [Ectothiorhodospiraceae bacterium]
MNAVDDIVAGLRACIPRLGLGSDVSDLRRLTGGASQQTWRFVATGPAGQRPLILRLEGMRKRAGDTESGIETEARLLRFVEPLGVPVPRVYHVLEAEDGLGRGYIMECVEGETLPKKIFQREDFAEARAGLARQCGEVLARIHRAPTGELGFLRSTSAQEELELEEAAYRRRGMRRPVFELAFRWLRHRVPRRSAPPALVHGDFRNGNLMIGPDGLRAVLDWELVHLGDPMEDLGWLCVNSWRFGRSHLPVGGFGTREELYAGYESQGLTVDREATAFWEVFGTLRWGLICQRMAEAFISGEDPTVERAAIGRRSSETEIDLLMLIDPRLRS